MKQQREVIILGGGVIGLTCAYFLAREGVRVLLCEQGKVGAQASWAGAGILPPSDWTHAEGPFDRLRALSGRLFPGLCQELKDCTGIDNGYTVSGGLEFLGHIGEADPQEWYGHGIKTRTLTEAEVARLEPALSPGLGQALHLPTMAQLRNPRHLQALRAACQATGLVSIRENFEAQQFVVSAGRIQEVRSGNESLAGGTFLLATGAWTDRLLEPLGCRLNIEPVRGQIALLHPGRLLVRHILLWGPKYLVPRLDGRILIGSTEEWVGYDRQTTQEGIEGLLQLGQRLVPELGDLVPEMTWAGLRPGSPDGLPFIGPVPNVENLYVAAGHFRAGIQLSPGTALVVKEMVLGQPLSMPLEPFRLDR